jgi:hypothetical protein
MQHPTDRFNGQQAIIAQAHSAMTGIVVVSLKV